MVTLTLDMEYQLHSIEIERDFYESVSVDIPDETMIVSMSPQEYLDGLEECSDAPTSVGVILCAGAHTLQMYSDCLNSDGNSGDCW